VSHGFFKTGNGCLFPKHDLSSNSESMQESHCVRFNPAGTGLQGLLWPELYESGFSLEIKKVMGE